MDPYRDRVARCTEAMAAAGIDVLLLTRPANMAYLTGDGRLCAFAMITRTGRVALGVPVTDVADVKAVAHAHYVRGFDNEVGMLHSIAALYDAFRIREGTVGVEYTYLTQSMMAMFTHPHAKPEGLRVVDATHILSSLRLQKDADEIARIAMASRVAAIGMGAAHEAVRPGMTESQVAAVGEHAMRDAGAEDFWKTYVSSGPRTNLAHGVPSGRVLLTGDLVMVDMHPIVAGYSADICRTFSVGAATGAQEASYADYLHAQQETILAARAGATMADLEAVMHGILRETGHTDHVFGPPIHGVGIEFEEAPLPASHAFFHGEEQAPALTDGVVLAVGNCGLYMGAWAVRVEDTIVISGDEPEILTVYPRALDGGGYDWQSQLHL
jgi:Xaa-Pro aminopeptidase